MQRRDFLLHLAAGLTLSRFAAAQTQPQPVTLAQGRFRDADLLHRGSGGAVLLRLPDGGRLIRFEPFTVTRGPDLFVRLVKHADPANARDVMQGYVTLGRLRAHTGPQQYDVPANVDVAGYGSVVVWCEIFGVLFAVAPLRAPAG